MKKISILFICLLIANIQILTAGHDADARYKEFFGDKVPPLKKRAINQQSEKKEKGFLSIKTLRKSTLSGWRSTTQKGGSSLLQTINLRFIINQSGDYRLSTFKAYFFNKDKHLTYTIDLHQKEEDYDLLHIQNDKKMLKTLENYTFKGKYIYTCDFLIHNFHDFYDVVVVIGNTQFLLAQNIKKNLSIDAYEFEEKSTLQKNSIH